MKTVYAALTFLILLANSAQAQANSFEILTPQVEQGGTAIARIIPQFQGPLVCLSVFGNQYVPNKKGFVVIGVKADAEPTKNMPNKYLVLMIECGRGVRLNWDYEEIEVLEGKFEKTRTAAFTGKPQPRKDRQKTAIDGAFSQENMLVYDLTLDSFYTDPMNLARDVIDPYGYIYKNNPTLFHTGSDLRAPVGNIVKAVNRGKVVLVAKRFKREGNMIIINHGLGIFSVYMHLSKMNVKKGAIVEKGQYIGLSGKTGAGVREPHLHFNIRIKDTYVDPLKFIDTIDRYLP